MRRPCRAHSQSQLAPRCRSDHSTGHISSATMLSLQLECFTSTSSASSSAWRLLMASCHSLPVWPCCTDATDRMFNRGSATKTSTHNTHRPVAALSLLKVSSFALNSSVQHYFVTNVVCWASRGGQSTAAMEERIAKRVSPLRTALQHTHRRALVDDFCVVHQQGVHLHLSIVNHGQVLQQAPASALVLQQIARGKMAAPKGSSVLQQSGFGQTT